MAKKKPNLSPEERERIRRVELALRPFAIGDKVRLRKDSYHYSHEPKGFNPRRRHRGIIRSIVEDTDAQSLGGYRNFTITVDFKHHPIDDVGYPRGPVTTHWVRPCDIERIK